MKTLFVTTHAKDINTINLEWLDKPLPSVGGDECLIKVISSGVNPSDALAAIGYFNHAVLPRVPGRDFAGTVVEGPAHLIGKNVWGTGGAAGISSDGTQAEFIKLSTDAVSLIPTTLDVVTAGVQPLPYVTAYYGLVKRAQIKNNESVLVVGALGQVGSAAMAICNWKKCNAIALVRGNEEVKSAQALGWKVINSEDNNLTEKILATNNGQPVDVILNSVGNIYWNDFSNVLAEFGRHIVISARENSREATVNLFELYRANQTIIGINTVSLDFIQNAKLLEELKTGFEENKLTPLKLDVALTYTPQQANEAYKKVMQGSAGRIAIKFI